MLATNYFETSILNLFRGISFTAPSNLYAGLYLNDPTETGTAGTEISYQGYSRQLIDFTAPTENAKYGAGAMGIENSAEITFPKSNTNAGTISYIGILDSIVGGNMLARATLTPTRPVLEGYSPKILVGEGIISLTGNFSSVLKQKVLNTFRKQSIAGISPYLALFTSNPQNGGNEFSAPSYERKLIQFGNPSQNATGATQISNINKVATNVATTDWGIWGCTVTMDANKNGNVCVIQDKENESFPKSTQATIEIGTCIINFN